MLTECTLGDHWGELSLRIIFWSLPEDGPFALKSDKGLYKLIGYNYFGYLSFSYMNERFFYAAISLEEKLRDWYC
jgi:hypothetical protein